MASWYSKWFGKWFSGWFYKTPTPPVPPQPPTPPAGSIQSRAPVDSPSILSGVRAAEEEEKKRDEDAPIECVEYEDGIEGITKANEIGCTFSPPPPPPPVNRCGHKYPRKIKVSWAPVGNRGAAVELPDVLFSYFGKWPALEGTPYHYSRVVGNSPTHSVSFVEFTVDPFAERIIEANRNQQFTMFQGFNFPFDMYNLDAVKLGPNILVTTTFKKYGWVPDPPPASGQPLIIQIRPPDCQTEATQQLEFTTVTTASLQFGCQYLTGTFGSPGPIGMVGARFFIKFSLYRYLALITPLNDTMLPVRAAIGGGAIPAANFSQQVHPQIGWPGVGSLDATASYIEFQTPEVTVAGSVFQLEPPPLSYSSLPTDVTFQFSDWVELP